MATSDSKSLSSHFREDGPATEVRPVSPERPPEASPAAATSVDKVWLRQYPEGVPPEADVEAYRSIKQIFEESARRFGQRPAYSNFGVSKTYDELLRESHAFGAYLGKELGLKKGDRIALMLPNVMQYPVALFGAFCAGLTVVNVNPLYTPTELLHQLRDSGAKAIVVVENALQALAQVVDDTEVEAVITTSIGDLLGASREEAVREAAIRACGANQRVCTFLEALRTGMTLSLDETDLGPDDLAFIQYTGGTTGVAKGAMLTHANIVANLQQLSAWIARDLVEGEETAVVPLPLYHVYALTSSLLYVKLGAQSVLVTNPRDLPSFVELLKQTSFSMLLGVNTLYGALVNAAGFSDIDMRRLKVASAGGMAVQRVVAERWQALTGVPLVEGYGLTEASPVVISNALNVETWTGSIGLPIPSTEAAIFDELGTMLAPGEVGEICVRGPQVMRGYWNRPDETRKVLTDDGWLRTGDMGLMDASGYFKLTNRKKDMVIVSGFKVFPSEIEDVLMMHPGVLEVGAFGVADERSGETVKVVVVKRDPDLTEQALYHRSAAVPSALRAGQLAHVLFPLWARRDRVQVFWGPRHQLPLLPRAVRTALTVHDLVWKDCGETMRFPGRQIENFFTPRALARADAIAVVSQFTRHRLEHYFPQCASQGDGGAQRQYARGRRPPGRAHRGGRGRLFPVCGNPGAAQEPAPPAAGLPPLRAGRAAGARA